LKHVVHAPLPASANVPRAHGKHAALPAALQVLMLHGTHSPPAPCEPAGHGDKGQTAASSALHASAVWPDAYAHGLHW